MRLENELLELQSIARAHRAISKEMNCGRLAKALLDAALEFSRADRGENPIPFEASKSRIADGYPALEHALNEDVGANSPFGHEYRIVHEDCTTLHVVAAGQFDLGPTGDVELEGIIADITERKGAEQALADARAELARAARLASLGELAGSIIHDVNQPLSGILASAEAALRWLTRDPSEPNEASKSITRVVEQARRASSLVLGLGSLVRDGRLQFADVQVNDVVEEVLLRSKGELERGGVSLQIDFATSMPKIMADRAQLQQVVLNLVRNAIDAMHGVKARALTASSKVDDGHALVTIGDTGVGVGLVCGGRLFDALYTTKEDGLGLGLSICRRIVDAHGGRIWMEKCTTRGARFTFALPASLSNQSSVSN